MILHVLSACKATEFKVLQEIFMNGVGFFEHQYVLFWQHTFPFKVDYASSKKNMSSRNP